MATRENLKKTNVSVLRSIAADLGINSKRKKDDLICDILSSQTPAALITPVVQLSSCINPTDVQFKENLPPFNAVHYQSISEDLKPPSISFSMVYEFMITRRRQEGDQCIQNFKGLDKSVKHFDAGDVQNMCIARIDESTVYIKAFCLASMKKQRYQVFLCISNSDGTNRVDFAYCQCPIGLAQACSHIGGLLFTICNMQSTTKAPLQGEQSCTSTLCQWKVPRTMNQKPKPISNLNLSRPKAMASSDTDDDVTRLSSPSHGSAMARFDPRHSEDKHHSLAWSLDQLGELRACFPHTGMAHLWNIPDSNVPSSVEVEVEVETSVHPLYLKMEKMLLSDENLPPPMIDEELVNFIEEKTRGQRLCEMWRALHLGRITSSMFGDVLLARETPAKSLVNQIIHGSNLDRYTALPPPVQWWIDHEAEARKDYLTIKRAINENTDVHPTGITLYSTHSFLGASSDGKVIENGDMGLLEIKCPFSIKGYNITQCEISEILELNDRHFCLEMSSSGPTLRKSHKFYAQVQGEMAIKSVPWVDFVVWTAAKANNIFIERILFDEQFVTSMMPKLVKFYMEQIYPLLYKC
ncbi:uncharacterized protein LOC133198978 [Saccostrea echinata]|uniref:uncharacterized protein LOC133198978 n=1 Tax=Saccostrea echinata TaxID=191078 RepID=UPI002A7EB70D|nr:uncharacterized protein LOC133198978 [Saccostrea echinata]